MEFGRLYDVNGILFRLPPPHARSVNGLVLKGDSSENFQLRIACPVWNYKEWVGSVYPSDATPEQFLFYYAQRFSSIELNSTHYGLPSDSQVEHWLQSVGNEFRFCPKVPRVLSHDTRLGSDKEEMKAFHKFLGRFGSKLGMPFVQLPPHFPAQALGSLKRFLDAFGSEFPLAVELRHESWFHDGALIENAFNLLEARGISSVITDVSGRRDVLHSCLPANGTLIRFVGNNLHPSDRVRIRSWAQRLSEWKDLGLQKIHFVIHQPSQAHTPELARELETVLHDEFGMGPIKTTQPVRPPQLNKQTFDTESQLSFF